MEISLKNQIAICLRKGEVSNEIDKHLYSILCKNISLIVLVDKSYNHISDLECLKNTFEGGLSDYYTQYHPFWNELIIILGQVIQNTYNNHYNTPKSYDIYDVIADFDIKLSKF